MKLRPLIRGVCIAGMVLGIAIIVAALVRYGMSPGVLFSDYITAVATLAIALLTTAYVLTNTNQLSTMRRQLSEMKRSREISAQPLPLVNPTEVSLEKPTVFYSPPEKEYSGLSRYHVTCTAANHGSSPAVCIHVCACIHLGSDGNDHGHLAAARFFNVLPGSPSGAEPKEQKLSFMFTDDDKGEFLDALRSAKPRELPRLQICTAYKNVIGGAFYCRQRYALFVKDEAHDEILKNWYTNVSSFAATYRNDIESLRKQYDRNPDAWNEAFDQLKEGYANRISGDDVTIAWHLIPQHFSIRPISEEKYESIVGPGRYGGPVTAYGCACE